jgi:RNA recognition motif-containing protein
LDVPAAYAFNYHFDNGVFRGLAFANYRTPEETEIVVNTINGLEIGGRKLRVEYKKMLPNMMENTTNNNNNSHDNITVNIIRKKERESSSSQPGSPLLSERKLPTNPDEGIL